MTVETLHRVQTDTSPDALQKAVCFSEDHTLLATGGVDGFLRVWEVQRAQVDSQSWGRWATTGNGVKRAAKMNSVCESIGSAPSLCPKLDLVQVWQC